MAPVNCVVSHLGPTAQIVLLLQSVLCARQDPTYQVVIVINVPSTLFLLLTVPNAPLQPHLNALYAPPILFFLPVHACLAYRLWMGVILALQTTPAHLAITRTMSTIPQLENVELVDGSTLLP
jgi:hypothetical protein